MTWSESPIVRFVRDGETFTLGRDPQSAPALHLHGSTGLGLPPVDISKSDRLTGDGSIVRGIRYTDREVYLPMLLEAKTVTELNTLRAGLYDLLAPDLGPVEVQVESEQGVRSITGYLTDGLTGDFGDEFHGAWQTLGLTFECADPWWSGPEQIETLRLNPGSKPFISTTVPFFPVTLAQSTVIGSFEVEIGGAGPVSPVWEVVGPGTDLVISNGTDRIEINGNFTSTPVVIDTAAGRITPDRWADVTLRSRLFQLQAGANRLTVTMVGATTASEVRLVYRERYRGAI